MKRFLQLVVVVIACLVSLGAHAQWTEDMYNQYTYSNYTNFAPFSQSIVSTGYDADLLEAAVFFETNRQRALHGLKALKYDHNLMVSAHNHSVDMVNENFFSHTSPVPGYTTMSDRLEKVGIQYREAAENIALRLAETTYAETARALVDQWMHSQGHRENILNPDLEYLGCGAAFYYEHGNSLFVKATQNFVTFSASSCPASRPTTSSGSSTSVSTAWTTQEIASANTAQGATFMTPLEQEVILYVNLARMYPRKFARVEVADYDGPEGFTVKQEFPEYKQSLLRDLQAMEPVGALQPDRNMYDLALCWATEMGESGIKGHNRISCPNGYLGECCQYAVHNGRGVALQWLIDAGQTGLGHRKICLSARYSVAGVSHQPHSKWRWCTVMDFR
jgi:uncharacterized protein YkwD